MSYILSSKGEKNIWFEDHMYQNHRENQLRCTSKGFYGRFHTTKAHKDEKIIDQLSSHSCQPVTREEFLCKRTLTRLRERES